MKRLLIFAFILNTLCAIAQSETSKFDIRLGAGASFMGSGDMTTTAIENELNYKANNYFTIGTSVGYAKSNYGVFLSSNYIQENMNVFYSPFKNNNINDFRIGLGVSFIDVSDSYESSRTYIGNQLYSTWAFDNRKSFGFNFIIENSIDITNRFFVGVKIFTQPYISGDINSGALIKIGYKL